MSAQKITPCLWFDLEAEQAVAQEEVDELWDRLGADGTPNRCGWLADKFGVPWQIVPRAFSEMLQSGDAARTQRVMRAMFEMKKLDIAKLRQAFGPNQEEVS